MADSPSDSLRKQQSSRRAQKLSEERLARKRELDRQAQRSARVKTKNTIAYLESRIETLTKVHGSGNVKSLIDQIEDQRKENEALKSTLRTIGKLVVTTDENDPMLESKTKLEDEEANVPNHHNPKIEDSPDNIEQRNNDQIERSVDSASLALSSNGIGIGMGLSDPDSLANSYSQISFPNSGTDGGDLSGLGHINLGVATFTVPSAESLLHAASLFGQSQWQASMAPCCSKTILLSNELFAQCSRLRLQDSSNHATRDADIAIRAILHGWNAVTERYALDPIWQTLRHADNAMFQKCVSPMERLVCLRAVLLKLRHQLNPTEQNLEAVPYFLHERPSQSCIQHPPLIDYLAWPGLRERLVFNPHTYCSDKFAMLFWPCFRFVWEYDFRDAFTSNRQTGLYHLSAPFMEHSRNIQCYRMSPEFFTEFPELKADIQVAAPPPEVSLIALAGGTSSFGVGPSQGLEPAFNEYTGSEGFSDVEWPVNLLAMKAGEV